MAGMNSHIIYKEVTGSKVSRRKFLLSLAEELWQILHKSLHKSK